MFLNRWTTRCQQTKTKNRSDTQSLCVGKNKEDAEIRFFFFAVCCVVDSFDLTVWTSPLNWRSLHDNVDLHFSWFKKLFISSGVKVGYLNLSVLFMWRQKMEEEAEEEICLWNAKARAQILITKVPDWEPLMTNSHSWKQTILFWNRQYKYVFLIYSLGEHEYGPVEVTLKDYEHLIHHQWWRIL